MQQSKRPQQMKWTTRMNDTTLKMTAAMSNTKPCNCCNTHENHNVANLVVWKTNDWPTHCTFTKTKNTQTHNLSWAQKDYSSTQLKMTHTHAILNKPIHITHTIASSQPYTVGLASIAHKQSHTTIAHNNRAHQSRTIEHNNATQQSHTTITHEQSHKTIAHNNQTWARNTHNSIFHQPRTAQLESTQIAQQW